MRLSPCHSADVPSRQESDPALPSHPSCLSQPKVSPSGQRSSKVDDRRDSKVAKGLTLFQSTTRFIPPYVRPFGERKDSGIRVDRSFEIPDTKSVYTSISKPGKRQERPPRTERFVSVCYGLSKEHHEEQPGSGSRQRLRTQVYSSPLGSEGVRAETESRNDMDAVQVSNTLSLDARGKDAASQQPQSSSFYQEHKLDKGRHLAKKKKKAHLKGSDADSAEYTPKKYTPKKYTPRKESKGQSTTPARVPLYCTFCDMAFDRATDYARHCETIRHQQASGGSGPKKTVCDRCGQSLTRMDALKRHQRKTCLLVKSPGAGILPAEGMSYGDMKMPAGHTLKTEMDELAL